MKKKMVALLLCLTVSAGVLAGCSDDDSSSTSGEAGQEEDEELYTVTMVMKGTAQPEEERIEEQINAILEPELNANIDLVVLPWGTADQQIQLMLSGDEKIDLLYTNTSSSQQYMNAGQIIDMSELIDEYGDNVKEIFGEEILESISVDGFVWGTPTQSDRANIPSIFMRKDLVEKYDIDVDAIKEPADMEEVFEIVQEGEPTMTMLYSSSQDDTPMDRLNASDYFGESDMIGALMEPTTSTEVTNIYASDWYMDTATMLHDWFKKGYINQDAGTDPENWRSVFKAGNLFSIFYSYHPAVPGEFEAATGYEFEVVHFEDTGLIRANSYYKNTWSIAQNCENPEKTMQVLDYIYGSSEIMNLLNWGEEGVDYVFEDEENGIIDYPEGTDGDTVGYSLNLGWELPNQFNAHIWTGSEAGVWDKMEDFTAEAESSLAVGFVFDSTEYESELAVLTNVVAQYKGPINSGSVDPEEYIPKFLQDLEDAGIDKIIDAKQEQLNAWLAEK